ncbi:MAG: S-methyl-5'-thioadenosine phosphorylase [Acidobacteriota bacterium]|jgi:5'-methylthioadenosine phosphorylase
MDRVQFGIIGGSGFYEMPGFEAVEKADLKTPFGDPSDPFVIGTIDGTPVAFLARHGEGHRHLPTEVNYRANIYGFKMLGVSAILSASAVGSLKENVHPGHMVVPDQFVDRTRHRDDTFFGQGIVAHVGLADPFCGALRDRLIEACRRLNLEVHPSGTYLCMEGPQFSTRAESKLYRSWGMDIIGMTNLQEARLAREAEICYATLAMVTDYDCWHPDHDTVAIEDVIAVLQQNTMNAQKVLRDALSAPPPSESCPCRSALRHAIVTQKAKWPDSTRHRLEAILGTKDEDKRNSE